MSEDKVVYNSWPNGKVPIELQRPELEAIREKYPFEDAREVVEIFERKIADFAGAKYAVTVDCCTHAMELSLRYLMSIGEIKKRIIGIPAHTYISVPMMLKRIGFSVTYHDDPWTGIYQLKGTRVYDGAVRWMERMYVGGDALQCVSFQIKKRIPIGRGGVIITNDEQAANWLRLARYDGRDMSVPYTDPNHIKMQGFHYYMTPEDAARGILLMDAIPGGQDTGNDTTYPNVQKMMEGL